MPREIAGSGSSAGVFARFTFRVPFVFETKESVEMCVNNFRNLRNPLIPNCGGLFTAYSIRNSLRTQSLNSAYKEDKKRLTLACSPAGEDDCMQFNYFNSFRKIFRREGSSMTATETTLHKRVSKAIKMQIPKYVRLQLVYLIA